MNTPGVTNASCEFNVDTLQPTYRLLIGVPGKSNAFAIAGKLGLPDNIIEAAREQLSQETQNMEDILAELEAKRIKIEQEQNEITALRESIAKEQKQIRNKEKQLEDRRQKILEKANEEARDILADAKKTADAAISELRKTGRGGDMASMERTRSALREQVSKKNEKLSRRQEDLPRGRLKASQLHVGDRVRVISMGLKGIVTALPDSNGKVSVRCGIMNSKVDLSDLDFIEEDVSGNPIKKNSRSSMKKAFENAGGAGNKQRNLDFSRNQAISPELNLLGMTTDQAINELDKYLDDARMSHLSSVRIVHGKGTGALRKAVHNYLRKQKWIKSYRLGDFGEGDAGVTIVQLQ
jgi:DNA mismatch repair protein MutS2